MLVKVHKYYVVSNELCTFAPKDKTDGRLVLIAS